MIMEQKIKWGTNKVFCALKKVMFFLVGLIFAAIYIVSYILNIIARTLLGLSYYGLGDFYKGNNIFRFMFKPGPYGTRKV